MALEALCFDMPLPKSSRRKFQNEATNQLLKDQESAVGLCNPSFVLPPFHHPKLFVDSHFGANSKNPRKVEFLKGTTTLAFVFRGKNPDDKGGIILAVDARATAGEYIASRSVMKALEISDRMVATMAGGAADCQFWIRILAKQCSLYALQNNEEMSVAAASKWLSNILYYYKGMGISMGSMVAGCDKLGPSLYLIEDDGTRTKGDLFSVGSGSLNALSILDNGWKPEMTDKEAVDLGRKAVMHATYRDAASGGVCNLIHITSSGKEFKEQKDVSEMVYNFMKDMKQDTYDPDSDNL